MYRDLLKSLTCALFLMAVLVVSGCTGSGKFSANPPDQSNDGNGNVQDSVIAVRMSPQQPVDPPFSFVDVHSVASALPQGGQSGATTLRGASSFSWGLLNRNGAQYNPALPLNLVMPDLVDPNAVVFEPNWDPGDSLAGASFCLYEFNLPGYDSSGEAQTLGFNWLLPAVQKANVWVGLANFQKGTWDWFAYPEDDVLTLASYLPYIELSTNRILIGLLLIGHDQAKLSQLHVGQLETRGIGDAGPAPVGKYSLIPHINLAIWPLLPDVVDLSPGCSPIGDQNQLGACTAFANGDSGFNYELKRTYGAFGWDFSNTFNRCSPRYIYNQTGVDLGGSVPTGGRSTNEVGDWLLANGTATELNAPLGATTVAGYNTSTSWSAAALADAALLRPESKTFIGTDQGGGLYRWTDADIATAKHVLKTLGHVIVFRTYVDNQFQWLNYAGGASWTYNGSSIGGHAMCVVGYDTSKDGGNGAFKVRNSWGTAFGDNGYCWVSFNSMKSTTAGVYGFYFTEDCNSAVINRFLPGASGIFWPCGFWINVIFFEKVLLNWEPVPGASRYEIFRDNQIDPIGEGSSDKNYFEDLSLTDFDAHVYWIKAYDDQGNPSEFSNPVVGWRDASMG